MTLPHRPGHGLGTDVDRVRHPIPHRDVERRHGRSASITVDDVAGVTSVSQGDAASCRRNVVYAWMSTVLPVIQMRTTGVPVESGAPAATGAVPGTVAPPIADTPLSQV